MPEPERVCRQDLVVPPRSSPFPMALGAVVCGCLGFGLVWAFGIGRRQEPTWPSAQQTAAEAAPADPLTSSERSATDESREPARFPDVSATPRAADDRWRPRGSDGVEPVSLEYADPLVVQASGARREGSRFSARDVADVDPTPAVTTAAGEATLPADESIATPSAPPTDDAKDVPAPEDTATAEPPAAQPAAPPAAESLPAEREKAAPAELPVDPAKAAVTPGEEATVDVPAAAQPAPSPPDPVASPDPVPPLPAAAAAAAPPPTAATPPTATPAAPEPPAPIAAAAPSEPEASSQSSAPQPVVDPAPPSAAAPPPEPQAPVAPAAPAPPASSAPAPLRSPFSDVPPPAPFPVPAPVSRPAAIQPAAAPFAAAPPVVPDAAVSVPAAPAAAPPAAMIASAVPAAAGQGRPGPLQLEGLQSPQLAVEKRGPREIQVGKPARYEVLVRNVGSATANDVILRDSVPYGTALITTTPPATPAAASGGPAGDLVWMLGELPPGGQARVVIELMPQAEGEIGSVASVSFRADASVRSKATKPALAITCPEPAPVLIGRDAGLTITVTNPGSGVATGVVLEGFLPENVSHRSGRELEFDVGQLRPGESRTIDLVLGTRGPGVHTARLSARADGGLEVEQAVRLEVTAPTLEIAIDMPSRRFLQRPATCRVAMTNAGTATARAIELAAQLPPGFKFVRANNAGWHDARTHRVLWNLEELPPGETGEVEMVVVPVDLGPQKVAAAARSADGLADQVTHVCEVEGLAALFFEVADSEDPIEVDGLTEYVVRVGNQGTKPATGVRLTATLLGDLQPVAAQGPSGHRVDNLTISFEPLAKLAPSEEAVFRVRAKGRTAGDQRVQVQLTSEDHPAPITKEEVTRVYDDR